MCRSGKKGKCKKRAGKSLRNKEKLFDKIVGYIDIVVQEVNKEKFPKTFLNLTKVEKCKINK